MIRKIGAALLLVSALTACGGGGGGCSAGLGAVLGSTGLCSESVNQAPLADAGRTQNVLVGAVVTLDGTLSRDPDGQTLSYAWDWVSKPANSATVLASGNAAKAAFVADVPGAYVLSLVVSDGKAASAPVNVTVNASVINAVPVASAGTNQSVVVGQVVTLDGSGSTDADRQPISFLWRLLSKPPGSVAALTGETTARPAFTADLAGVYAASLVVSDGLSSSELAVVTVTAGAANVAPQAQAGINQNVVLGATVTLDGSASSDANRDPLTYSWTMVSKPNGSGAQLSSSTVVRPFFVADVAGTYVFSLSVNDGQLRSDFSAVTVVATSVNAVPVALAGGRQTVQVGQSAVLDASSSYDANRDPLTFLWTVVSAPNGSGAALSSLTAAKPVLVPDVAGTYVYSLVVSDGVSTSQADVAVVTATPVNVRPVAVASTSPPLLSTVARGTTVQLSAAGSSDPEGQALSYSWMLTTAPLGSLAQLTGATTASATLVPDVAGSYVVTLLVNDGQLDSLPVTVVINAGP